MDRIRVLSDGVANQIAAGEVVVRPASVVKELMENAVDAGSTFVMVNFRDGGRELIQVVDDGCGMSANDARLAFERHATSKIKNADDLYHLSSFGFRGEALPSIASVAEVELRTRNASSDLGVQIRINGGKFEGQTEVNIPQGTQFTVKNLFYNIPARKRFLKEANVETRHIITEFQRIALSNPSVGFTLCNNQSQVFNLLPSNLRQRIVGVIGKQIAGNLLDVEVDTSMIRIEGFVGRPVAAKKTNREQYLFVNGRYFRSPYFHKAVLQAYEKLIPADTQPSYFLYFTVDPERIDVNIHPTKTEIRFDDEQAIWQIINAAVRESLGKTGVIPMMDFDIDPSLSIPVYREGTPYKIPDIGINPDFNPFHTENDLTEMDGSAFRTSGGGSAGPRATQVPAGWKNLYESGNPMTGADITEQYEEFDPSIREFILGDEAEDEQGVLDIESGTSFRGLLALGGRYFATALGTSLVVIDAVRAHERVLYERYLRMLGNNSSVTQQLLFPEQVSLPSEDVAVLNHVTDDITAIGFDFSIQSDNIVLLTGIPGDIPASEAASVFVSMIERVREMNHVDPGERLQQLAAIMAQTGSRRTVRDSFSETETETLFDELMACDNFNYTPSGKAILSVITAEELACRFK